MSEPWPALGSLPRRTSTIRVEHGICCELRGDSPDFRWITLSPGFQGTGTQVQAILRVSRDAGEGADVGIPLWWCAGSRYYAAWAYEVKGSGSAGSSRCTEQQVLEWTPSKNVPVAAAALVLLRQARSLFQEPAGPGPDHPFPGDPAEPLRIPHLELKVNAESVEEALRAGLEYWFEADLEELAAFYAKIRVRREPALLAAPTRCVPPEALAALLLPLSREEAACLSVVGGNPGPQPAPDDRERRGAEVWPGEAPPSPEPSLAERLKASALLYGDSELASRPLESVGRLLEFGASRARRLNPPDIRNEHRQPSELEVQVLRAALAEVRRAAGANPMGLGDELVDARSRHLQYKADQFKAACQVLYGMDCTSLRRAAVTAVIQRWARDGLRFLP